MALADWSSTAGSNTSVGGVNIAEGCPAAGINNALRALMADVATGVNVSLLGTFLASSTLANARTALGVTEGSVSSTNFAALTNAANKVPYMTGSDAWSTTDFTSFGRSVVATGDAAALNTLLSTVGIAASSLANPGYVSIDLPGTSSNLKIQWGTVTLSANSDGTITFPSAFSSFSVTVVSGGPAGSGDAGSIHCRSSSTTTASVSNTSGGSLTGQYIAIGV